MRTDTPFKPCPICGHKLTTKDIRFFDDLDEPIEELHMDDFESDPGEALDSVEEYMQFVGTINLVTIDCNCGYTFGHYPSEDDLIDKTWFKKFVNLANTRADDIDQGRVVVMNVDNPCGRILSKFFEILHEKRPSLTMVDVIRAGLIYWQEEIKEEE